MSVEFSTSTEIVMIRPVIVGISMLSGSRIPPLVSFLSSSLQIRTRLPIGSIISSGFVSICFFYSFRPVLCKTIYFFRYHNYYTFLMQFCKFYATIMEDQFGDGAH